MDKDQYRAGLSERLRIITSSCYKNKTAAAKAAQITPWHFSKWLDGRVTPNVCDLYMFAVTSKVDPAWLLAGVDVDRLVSERAAEIIKEQTDKKDQPMLGSKINRTTMGRVISTLITERPALEAAAQANPGLLCDLAFVMHDITEARRSAGSDEDLTPYIDVLRALVKAKPDPVDA